MNKEDNIKEKFRQALISTVKVISDEYRVETELKKNLSSKNYNFFELDNLNSRQDYINLRAETDSEALKRKFSNKKIYQKNLPKNSECRFLYDISEKIRYELLGKKMLAGISKNLSENYKHKITIKRKDQLMNKEDNLKEKFKQALISTVRVISDDYKLEKEEKKNLSSKNYNFFELDNLNNKNDYIKLRAEADSEALKRKFSNKKIYEKNLPKNSSCRSLYDVSEKIR